MNAARSQLVRANALSQTRHAQGSFRSRNWSRQQPRRTFADKPQAAGPQAPGAEPPGPRDAKSQAPIFIGSAVVVAAGITFLLSRGKPTGPPGGNPTDSRGKDNNPSDKSDEIPVVKDPSKKPTAHLGAKNPNLTSPDGDTAKKGSRINDVGAEMNLSPEDRRRKSN